MRHVHTGRYDGTRILRNGREVPKAVTACGAEPDGSMVGRVAAISMILDGSQELCSICRARVQDATGAQRLTHLSDRRDSASGAQLSYLRILLKEATSKRYACDVSLDYNHLGGTTARYACFAIMHLKSAKERGWTVLEL